jgi:hypothetical protein
MRVKRMSFADADNVVESLPNFSDRASDDDFVPDKQPNDNPPALPKKLDEST